MDDKIISLILQAENEYRDAVLRVGERAEVYADNCMKKQAADFREQKQALTLFEETENESLDRMIADDEQRMEKETAQIKKRLRACMEEKADAISDRLKKEVLCAYGDN